MFPAFFKALLKSPSVLIHIFLQILSILQGLHFICSFIFLDLSLLVDSVIQSFDDRSECSSIFGVFLQEISFGKYNLLSRVFAISYSARRISYGANLKKSIWAKTRSKQFIIRALILPAFICIRAKRPFVNSLSFGEIPN